MHYWSIVGLAQRLRDGQVSPVEVTRHLLARIDRLDSFYHSYVTVLHERALAQAKQAEAEIARGYWRGPLHGVPVSLKDIVFTDYAKTKAGMTIHENFVPPYSGTVTLRLERSGAIVLGKVKTAEGAWTDPHPNEVPAINPWNETFWTGASSIGSAVSVALGMGYASIGSCTGGSIRLPAQSCGIVGLKPTWGRVSRHGVFPLSPSLDHIGPLTRSAEDAAILLGAIAGADPNDPSSLSGPVPDYLGECSGGLAGLRIGIDPSYVCKDSHADVVAAFGEVERAVAAAGAHIRAVTFPPYRDAIRCWTSILQIEAAHSHRETFPARAREYGPALAGMLELGRAKPVAEVAETLIAREVFTNGLATIFRDVDLLMIPVTPAGASTKEEVRNLSGVFLEEFIKYTAPFNLSGYPTITVPVGEDRNGMPIGMQFVGPPLFEALLCRAGAAFQRLTDWHTRHPPERS